MALAGSGLYGAPPSGAGGAPPSGLFGASSYLLTKITIQRTHIGKTNLSIPPSGIYGARCKLEPPKEIL